MNNDDILPDNPPTPKPPVPPTPTPVPADDINASWLAVLNQERAANGRKAMVTDAKLVGIAQQWADAQASSDTLSHGNFSQRINSVYPNTYASENVAYGSSDVAGTNQQWKESSGHWTNMMGNYNRTGIGRAVSRTGKVYWCADFVLD